MASILLIEDDLDNMLLLETILSEEYEIFKAHTAENAIEIVIASEPGLILCDIELPGMSGEAFIQKLRGPLDRKRLPVIAVTAHAMSGDKDRFINLGFNDYLSKPLKSADVFAAISRFLKK